MYIIIYYTHNIHCYSHIIIIYLFKFQCDINSTAINKKKHISDYTRDIDVDLNPSFTINQTDTATENLLVRFLILLTTNYIGYKKIKYILFLIKYTQKLSA